MKMERFILMLLFILLIFSCFFCREVFSQYHYNSFILKGNHPFSLYDLYNIFSYSNINQSINFQNKLMWARNKTLYQPYLAVIPLNNTFNNHSLPQRTQSDNIFSNPIFSYDVSTFINPFNNQFQSNGLSGSNTYGLVFDNLFIDPFQRNGLVLNNSFIPEAISPVFFMFSQTDTSTSKTQNTEVKASEESVIKVKDDLAAEVMALANDLTHYVLSLTDHMGSQLDKFQTLSTETKLNFAETMEEFMENAMGWSSEEQSFVESVLPMAASFAEKGMELGAQFAEKGMELGYEFASKGEEVGPMANRILFMATQIGVMADRIGEMADRILFMADNIVEFGDKILYVSQLIVYTEELMVNVNVLINETIRTISDMILTMLAITTDNDTYLQLRAELLKNDNQVIPLIYENMNRMLDHMLEYSLKLLENEALTEENQLKVRELQIELREATMSANDCFCPGFCVDPNQCI